MADVGKPAPDLTCQVMMADEVAALLHIHKSTLYRLITKGKFPHFRMGSDFRFSRQAIDEWRKAQEYKPSPRSKAR